MSCLDETIDFQVEASSNQEDVEVIEVASDDEDVEMDAEEGVVLYSDSSICAAGQRPTMIGELYFKDLSGCISRIYRTAQPAAPGDDTSDDMSDNFARHDNDNVHATG